MGIEILCDYNENKKDHDQHHMHRKSHPGEFGFSVRHVVFLVASVIGLRLLLLLRKCRYYIAERQKTLVDGDTFL